ncbi:MAG TPA: hypothetical protein VF540_01050, partial [Segetibacter sp.]
MLKVYKLLFLIIACWLSGNASAQVTPPTDSSANPSSIDVNLENIFNQKAPHRYKVANVIVTGNQFFDAALLISIANINVGDEI